MKSEVEVSLLDLVDCEFIATFNAINHINFCFLLGSFFTLNDPQNSCDQVNVFYLPNVCVELKMRTRVNIGL